MLVFGKKLKVMSMIQYKILNVSVFGSNFIIFNKELSKTITNNGSIIMNNMIRKHFIIL